MQRPTLERTLGFTCLLALSTSGCPGGDNPDMGAGPGAWAEAFPAEDQGWFLSTFSPAPGIRYAVGGTPDQGRIMRDDGSGWSTVDPGVQVPLLNWVFGSSESDLTFVGNEGTILHYDGSTYTMATATTTQDLWGVWGSASNDLWAVGGNGRDEDNATILRYDGTSWRHVPRPTIARPRVGAFFKVWGTSADNLYIVGQRGVILHWNGSDFTEIETAASEDLVALWGTGPDRIAIVGGRSNGQIVTYNGTEWTRKSLAPLPGLNGVWMGSPETVHIGGEDGILARVDFDTLEVTREEAPTSLVIHAIYGDSTPRLTAVGGSLLSTQPPFRGVALERSN